MPPRSSAPKGESKRVLVVVLVFFILATLGLGYWVYACQDEIKKAKDGEAETKKRETAANEERDYYRHLAATYRAYLGYQPEAKTPMADSLIDKQKFDDGSLYKGKPMYDDSLAVSKKLIAESPWDAAKAGPKEPFKAIITTLRAEVTDLKTKLAKAEEERIVAQGQRNSTQGDRTKDQAAFNAAVEGVKKEFEKERKDLGDRVTTLEDALKKAQDTKDLTFVQPIVTENLKLKDDIAKASKRIRELDEKIANLTGKLASLVPSTAGGTVEDKADLSARGKVVRISLTNPRKLTIGLGKMHGLTEQTTFAIHGYQPTGKPKVRSKASIEVFNVGPETSEAIITEMYHPDPNTDLLSGKRKTIDVLSKDNTDPVVPGDALINSAWNPNARTHIVIAGLIDLYGTGAINMSSLVQILEKQNIIVDAYVDPLDGAIKGKGLSRRTDYVLLGSKASSRDPNDMTVKSINESIDKLINEGRANAIPVKQPHIFFRETGLTLPRTISGE